MSAKSKNSRTGTTVGPAKGKGGSRTVRYTKKAGGFTVVASHRLKDGTGKAIKKSNVAQGRITRATVEAAKIVDQYQIILTNEDGEWYGHGLEMPKVMADGKTVAQCVKNTREAMTAAVTYLIESGQVPPTPAKEGQRTEQVNIRLGALEKTTLTAAAKRKGFKSLAGFLRASALDASH